MLITLGLNFALKFPFNKVTEVLEENIWDICPSYVFCKYSFYRAKLYISAICKLDLLYQLYCYLKKEFKQKLCFS